MGVASHGFVPFPAVVHGANDVRTHVGAEGHHGELLQALAHQHRAKLYRFIVQKIGHAGDAQDLVQQTFVEALRAIPSFKGESELSTWLYGIAKNLVRNYLSRAPHRRYDWCSDDALVGEVDSAPTPQDALAMKQQMKALGQAMADIPRAMREVVWMIAIDEMSYEAAAMVLKVPTGTVRSRLSRARSALRSRMPPGWESSCA